MRSKYTTSEVCVARPLVAFRSPLSYLLYGTTDFTAMPHQLHTRYSIRYTLVAAEDLYMISDVMGVLENVNNIP